MSTNITSVVFDAEDVFRRIRSRLPVELPSSALDRAITPPTGDHSLNAWSISAEFLESARPAAVLVGLIPRGDELYVLLTQRTIDLRDHGGQIAFPGGKVDPRDASPAATALREAQEEIALPSEHVEVLGYLDPYLTRTGFRIIPVVARITPPFVPICNPAEVDEAFEVPFSLLMEESSYELSQREWKGTQRYFYSIAFEERMIWGITAGILRILYERLFLP